MSDHVHLLPVDALDVTILVDNYSDALLPSTETAHRPPPVWDWIERESLRAEHGYSALLAVEREGRRQSILYDAGLGRETVLHNLMFWRCDQGTCVPLSSRTDMPITTNVLRHARGMTGVDTVHAFVGSMNLTGAIMEPLIGRTLDELAAISPHIVVPGHCTGWKATHESARHMPGAYIQSSVGTRLHFA